MKPKKAQLYYVEEQLGKINALQRRMHRNPRTREQKISNLLMGDEQTMLLRELRQNDVITVINTKTGLWELFSGRLT